MNRFFKTMDFTGFWNDSEYAMKEYVGRKPTDQEIEKIEQELGYKLPEAYLTMMKQHNGGVPFNNCFPTLETTSWAEDHIAITGILGLDSSKRSSLCGTFGSRFMIEEWGYPEIGVVVCDCPSAGHDAVMLDYRKCGPHGEPEVVHVDQECEYEITFLAKDFETFILGLVNEAVYDRSEETKEAELEKVNNGAFSPLLRNLCDMATDVDLLEVKIRTICRKIVEEKGFFALHADELSLLMYDLQFWLYSRANNTSCAEYLKEYEMILAMNGEFSTGGYAQGFVEDWLRDRMAKQWIVESESGILFTPAIAREIVLRLDMFANGRRQGEWNEYCLRI